MISKFFVDHPVFANVIAIVTIIIGVVALRELPVEQYPKITPPTVQVSTVYPGANARVVAETVAAPIEQQVNGVENMLYMSSNCSSDGSYALTVTFEIGTDLNTAQVLVQNRVTAAEPRLPDEVRRQGVTVKKQSTDIILVISLTSPDRSYNSLLLANYATLRIVDPLTRVAGVGDVRVSGGSEYGMRIWIDPDKLQARNLSTSDVITALSQQNVQVAAGQIGQPPAPKRQRFQYTVTAMGRLSDPKQFEEIIVKTGRGGRATYLRDVATVELGAQSYDTYSARGGQEAVSVLVYQLPGANALDVADRVRAEIDKLSKDFPPGVEYSIPFDTTRFVRSAVEEVYRTLFEAGVLVLIVILVFLQSWRAILVPATTVPVTIIGAFAFMYALGFTVNLLTLFGLVLAIGIVVDDAIVIVENAAHHIDRGERPREATIRAMAEVTGPVIGITLVLMAVFLPASFMGGITGQLYRQFALTIAATALISAINALTLKPAQCATYLRPSPPRRNVFSRAFNYVYGLGERGYTWTVGHLLRRPAIVLVVFAGLLALTGWWYLSLPTGFLPTEDQGYLIVSVQLPEGASQQRTRDVGAKLDRIFKDEEAVETWITLGGLSLLDGTISPNASTFFVMMKDWDERKDPSLIQEAVLARLRQKFAGIEEAIVFPIVPPAIRGLGTTGGFQLEIEDRAGVGEAELARRTMEVIEAAQRRPELGPLNTTCRAGAPQIYVDIDRIKVERMNIAMPEVFNTLQANLGSYYVNDFNKYGRVYQVRVQAASGFRDRPDDINNLKVRSRDNKMVPMGAIARVRLSFGPQVLTRYLQYTASAITGEAAPGRSSGEALAAMEEVARETLPATMGTEWTSMAYQEKRVSGQVLTVFALAVVLVYLVLAAQYESWLLPASVILVVPLGVLGASAAIAARGLANNVYVQIGVVLIIALASKNAILIVEFARELRLSGRSIREAAIEAARLRFRPILMTSFAFILGVAPLVWATGAGAASRQAVGTAVFGGMLASTILAVFFVPVFFVAIQWLSELRGGPQREAVTSGATPLPSAPGGKATEQETGPLHPAPSEHLTTRRPDEFR